MATTLFEDRDVGSACGSKTPLIEFPRRGGAWNAETFARDQMLGLARRLFFPDATHRVHHVVLSATDSGTEIASVCQLLGETLASETRATIVVVASGAPNSHESPAENPISDDVQVGSHFQRLCTRLKANLWFAAASGFAESWENDPGDSVQLRNARLAELRREFDYSIVESTPAGESSDAAVLGQTADGLILVLKANETRRAAARKVSENLQAAGVKILGAVLVERTFPIPHGIYKRL